MKFKKGDIVRVTDFSNLNYASDATRRLIKESNFVVSGIIYLLGDEMLYVRPIGMDKIINLYAWRFKKIEEADYSSGF